MWAVLDLETTIKSYAKRKASPFHPDNWVVMAGWCTKANPHPTGQRYPFAHWRRRLTEDFIDLLGNGTRFLVGQNIKFDILHIINKDEHALAAWMKYVAGGGLIWDLQLAEYVMEGQDQASHMLSMDELALRYGEDLKVDEVKKLWEAGIDTPDIDPDLLSRYLLGEDLPNGGRREGDIGVTRNVFLKQLARAQKEGMSRLLMLEFGALIASIEMERNGMYVDKALGYKLADELRVELDAAKDELHAYLPVDLPFEFNWGNRYHLSPVIFGGKVKYQRREYDLKDGTTTFVPPEMYYRPQDYAYAQKDQEHYLLADGTLYPKKDDSTLSQLYGLGKEVQQFKGGKNAGEYKTKKVKVDDYDKPKSRMVDDYWVFPGFTKPLEEWASSTDGLYSVGSDVIKTLTENTNIPFLKTLGRVTAISKDLSTYFISDDGEKGMLTLVGDDGLVHHSINHTSTVTGRLSGNAPNLQNIPKGNKSKAKQMFVSRFPGGDIGQSDFSSLEVYCQAMLTKSALLIKDLLEGLDLHCVRLAAKEHMPYEEVVKLAKGWKERTVEGTVIEHASVEEWDYKRTGAKTFSFQRAYGAGNATIAKATGMPLEEVEALAKAEDERYPEIGVYFAALEKEIERNAVPTSNFSAHPLNPAIRVQLRISRVRTPDGKRYTFRSHPSQAWQLKRGITATFSPTERMNYPVQGLGGQVMKAAMWINVREFYRRENFDGLALLVNTVHDAAYRDAHPSVSLASSELMHACMEAASDFIAYWFKWDIPLPVPSDSVRGANMGEEVKLHSDEFKANVAVLRADLRARYMDGFVPNYMTLKDFQ